MNNNFFDSREKSLCCGCKVCSSVCPVEAIFFKNDEEGFWYPVINDEKCIKCNKCKNVCPLSKEDLNPIEEENQTYAVYSKSKEVLDNSTSGGIFTHISNLVLELGGVVFGHKFDENLKCVCVPAKTKEERNAFRGSKYVQSDMRFVYKQIKDEVESNKLVLVTGTPCQIDAVKNYFSNKIPENLITLDIVCHGVPSPKIFSEYVSILEEKLGQQIIDFKFRDKKQGWSNPHVTMKCSDGSTYSKLLRNDCFNSLFAEMDCILRPSCYFCKYAGKKRISDITIGDFWGIQFYHNDMFNNDKGVSLVLLNNKNIDIFNKLFMDKSLQIKPVYLDEATKKNRPLYKKSEPYFDRKKFFKDYRKRGLKYCLYSYCSHDFIIRLRKKVRRFIKNPLYVLKKLKYINKNI